MPDKFSFPLYHTCFNGLLNHRVPCTARPGNATCAAKTEFHSLPVLPAWRASARLAHRRCRLAEPSRAPLVTTRTHAAALLGPARGLAGGKARAGAWERVVPVAPAWPGECVLPHLVLPANHRAQHTRAHNISTPWFAQFYKVNIDF